MRNTLDLDDALIDALLARHPGMAMPQAIELAAKSYLAHDGSAGCDTWPGPWKIMDPSSP